MLPGDFDLSLDRDQICPRQNEFSSYAKDHPLWGMPFALTAISNEEQQLLEAWMQQGASSGTYQSVAPEIVAEVRKWETFLNGDSNRDQLMARYIHEHLYIADIYFPSVNGGQDLEYFHLVRPITPPGDVIKRISTRRPYDNPGVKRVYYRLIKSRSVVLAKNHMPYRFDDQRLARYRELFVTTDYDVEKLPGYDPVQASNPFSTFKDIPAKSRYQFMLDEAQFTIMGFTKGTVCRGQIALNVIEDHFWVVFENPNSIDVKGDTEFLVQEASRLKMPAASGSDVLSVLDWNTYADLQQKYLQVRLKGCDLNLMWRFSP